MGMSTYLQAFIPDTDETYQKQRKVLIACAEAGVMLPQATAEYFGSGDPEMYLLEKKLSINLDAGVHYIEYCEDSSEGFDIELSRLPKGVTKIRFTNSY